MPFETKWEPNGFYARFWGDVRIDEIAAKNRHFSNSPRSDKAHYQIFDGSEITSIVLPPNGINEIASHDIGMGYYMKNLSVIHIGSNPEVREFYERYISTCLRLNLTWKFQICQTLEQARTWIQQQEKRREEELEQAATPPFYFNPNF
ncbi:hypothetical protein QEH56_11980 [Pelagicoccus enzymogenes]|uniref:hypothetical protein n=1 Tax=Pelagicoccus enzymogenes TaxID=2773457 RepID=UPI00280D148B|nr:hypothetical protein [Pelagicoccus enzymogenes]MDQ8198875.1 hypothetical protein [Pelagicoccus enzymogenes]